MVSNSFKFIDLFAGIGGFRLALSSLGGECVFSSEIDKFCQKTYFANFNKTFDNLDIQDLNPETIPDFDILTAGFPCQPFSMAGKRLGFQDKRGNLFFEIIKILKTKRPKAFILENVKGLVSINRGKTLKTILTILREELGYFVPDPKILNARNFSVPQNRPRVFIVGFEPSSCQYHSFNYLFAPCSYNPTPVTSYPCLRSILETEPVDLKYYLNEGYWQSLQAHKTRHLELGNNFGYEILDKEGCSNAIMVGGQGRERNLIQDNNHPSNYPPEKNSRFLRFLTPREWARLQGFPDSFQIVVSDTQAYKQFGNSVAVPVVKAVARKVLFNLYGETFPSVH